MFRLFACMAAGSSRGSLTWECRTVMCTTGALQAQRCRNNLKTAQNTRHAAEQHASCHGSETVVERPVQVASMMAYNTKFTGSGGPQG